APGREVRTCVIHGTDGSIEDTNYADASIVHHPFKGGLELRKRDGGYLSMHELQNQHRRAIGADGVQKLFPNGVTDEFAVTLSDFHVQRGDEIAVPEVADIDFAGTLFANAMPPGVIERATYCSLKDELLSRLRATLPVDAVYLHLHGAMEVEHVGDGDGDLAA